MSGARTTSVSLLIQAPRATIYRALIDPALVRQWLAPEGMRSEIHAFEPREGGEFHMSLTYATERGFGTGKSSANTDTFRGRFLTLRQDECVKFSGTFEAADPALSGEMTLTFTLQDVPGGAEVTCITENIPEGVSLEDNETGSCSSLENLKRLFE